MRGTVSGLLSPHPIGAGLPGLYQTDELAQSLCAALDEVLAPVIGTLDSFPAYLDPATAPLDLLATLAGWLGLRLDANQPEQRQRDLVAVGVDLLSARGTVRGLRDAISLALDLNVEIVDPGGVQVSPVPLTALPGTGSGEVVVRVTAPDAAAIDLRRLESVVADAVPAHLRYRVEVQN